MIASVRNKNNFLPASFIDQKLSQVFFSVLFTLNFWLYYHYNFCNNDAAYYYYSDLVFHVGQIKHFFEQPRLYYEPMFHIITGTLAFIFFTSHKMMATIVLSSVQTLTAYLYYRLFLYNLKNKPLSIALIFFAYFSSTLFIPFISKHFLLGMASPTIWHNPTLIMVKPVAIITTVLTAYYLDHHITIKNALKISVLLLLSTLCKPAFSEIFIPAFTLFGALYYSWSRKNISCWLVIVLPTTLLLLAQLFIWHDQGAHIVFAPGLVIGVFTHNYVLALLRSIAFPLAILILRKPWKNTALMLSWIHTTLAYLQFLLLAEMPRYAHGNFGWGYSIGLSLIFLFSLIELAQWLKQEQVNTWEDIRCANKHLKVTVFLALAHLSTGIIWYIKIMHGGNYF